MKMTPIAYHLRETKFKVVSEENIVWTVDGEDGPRGNVEVEYIPNAYRLYVNPKCINRFAKK